MGVRGGGGGRSTTVAGVRYTLIGSSVSFSGPPILKIRNDLCFSIRSNTGGGGRQVEEDGRMGGKVGGVGRLFSSRFLSFASSILLYWESAIYR